MLKFPSDEIDMVLQHVGVEPTQVRSRCLAFLGNFVVDVDWAKCDCGRVRNRGAS